MSANDGKAGLISCDFVIEFELAAPRKSTEPSKEQHQSLAAEYDTLMQQLDQAQLDATSRPGAVHGETLLIFVRVREERLRAEMHRER